MKGNFLARLGEERHERAAKLAAERAISVNQLICEAVDLLLEGGEVPSSGARKAVLAEIADIASRLRAGFTLVPSAEAPGSGSWSEFMDGEAP